MDDVSVRDVLSVAAAFAGSYLGQLRTRGSLKVAVREAVQVHARRFARAVAEVSRRVGQLERGREAPREG